MKAHETDQWDGLFYTSNHCLQEYLFRVTQTEAMGLESNSTWWHYCQNLEGCPTKLIWMDRMEKNAFAQVEERKQIGSRTRFLRNA